MAAFLLLQGRIISRWHIVNIFLITFFVVFSLKFLISSAFLVLEGSFI